MSASCRTSSIASTTQRREPSRKVPRRVEEKAVDDKAMDAAVGFPIIAQVLPDYSPGSPAPGVSISRKGKHHVSGFPTLALLDTGADRP